MEDAIKNITGWLIIGQGIGMIFLVYQHFRRPDVDADKKLGINEATCNLKHKTLDDAIAALNHSMELIKENHLRHIETDISRINEKLAKQSAKMDLMASLMKDVITSMAQKEK